jgi:hypothetical protein
MEAALGSAFGGVWFEQPTAQMHVGVTSPESRRRAEEVAARAGLSNLVTETFVESTWQQLEAAQERWDGRLGELFGRGEVTSAVAPDLNAVKINLSSVVSASRRAALEREVASGAVAVSIETQPRSSLLVRPDEKQCASWLPGFADCDPTIVGGVRIEPLQVEANCTAGPAVIRKDRSTAAKATETLLLTAGHCIHDFNGVGEEWRAFNKKAEGKDIGEALTFLFGGVDVGVVKVDQTYWAAEAATPVAAGVAQWEPQEETDPFSVKDQEDPMKGAKACYSATWGGTLCGEVAEVGETIEYPSGVKMHETVKVDFEGTGKAVQGDSGAPWYASAASGVVHGIHLASHAKTKENEPNRAWFQPLSYSLAQLTSEKGLELELLTIDNDERKHPVVTSAEYPVTFSAEDTEVEDKFTAFGSTVECTESEFHGELTETQQEEAPTVVELAPSYGGCTAAGLSTTFTGNGCKYKFTVQEEVAEGSYPATADIVCPEEEAGGIQFDVGTVCTITIPPQSGLEAPSIKNEGDGVVMESGAIEGVAVKKQGLCGSSETGSGVYDLSKAVAISGASGGEAVKIDIGAE